MKKELKHISKFMSLVLRHKPEEIGISLDANGWARVDELIEKLVTKGLQVDRAIIGEVVATNDKKRFAFNEDGTLIRASQGHSISVALDLAPVTPPAWLYHGTAEKNRHSILQTGLRRQQRQHVHLSAARDTALAVGSRHGKPVILVIAAADMYKDGYCFYLSANGVWLTDHVPVQYISS